jgi:hypothetical protein
MKSNPKNTVEYPDLSRVKNRRAINNDDRQSSDATGINFKRA